MDSDNVLLVVCAVICVVVLALIALVEFISERANRRQSPASRHNTADENCIYWTDGLRGYDPAERCNLCSKT